MKSCDRFTCVIIFFSHFIARKNNVQPPDWVVNDDQYMDVAQPEEGGGESSGTPTLPGQSASVISRPAEERVKVTPQAKVSGRPPVATGTSRQQDRGRIPVAGGHSKGKCLKNVWIFCCHGN